MRCPRCRARLDHHLPADGQKVAPTPGDVTVCGTCLAFLEFGTDAFTELGLEDFEVLDAATRRQLSDGRNMIILARRHSQGGAA